MSGYELKSNVRDAFGDDPSAFSQPEKRYYLGTEPFEGSGKFRIDNIKVIKSKRKKIPNAGLAEFVIISMTCVDHTNANSIGLKCNHQFIINDHEKMARGLGEMCSMFGCDLRKSEGAIQNNAGEFFGVVLPALGFQRDYGNVTFGVDIKRNSVKGNDDVIRTFYNPRNIEALKDDLTKKDMVVLKDFGVHSTGEDYPAPTND